MDTASSNNPLTLDHLLRAYDAACKLASGGLPADAYLSVTQWAKLGSVYQIDLNATDMPGLSHLRAEINAQAGYAVRYMLIIHPETFKKLRDLLVKGLHPALEPTPRELAGEVSKMIQAHYERGPRNPA